MTSFRQTTAWKLARTVALNPIRRTYAKIAYGRQVPLTWCIGSNWGDALSPVLVQCLSGRSAQHLEGLHHDRYLAIGSILGSANARAEVWGSGFIHKDETVLEPPRAIHAVRGPLTRRSLINQGIDCPEVYGDPALLLPSFFNPEVEKQYEIGIIPHYIDKKHPWLERYKNDPKVRVIDIETGIEEFVREVKSCDVILSSSLHGLICSDAYRVPSAWIRLSDEVVGGDFKFRDYWHSIRAGEPMATDITETTKLVEALTNVKHRTLCLNLRKLILACPFLSEKLRQEVLDFQSQTDEIPQNFSSVQYKSNALQ